MTIIGRIYIYIYVALLKLMELVPVLANAC
jgi:hypothetical protein